MRKKTNRLGAFLKIAVILIFLLGLFVFWRDHQNRQQVETGETTQTQTETSSKQTSSAKKTASSTLPEVSPNDWELVLVNREHITAEMNPQLTEVGGIQVDSRIAQNVQDFLAAAQAIDAQEHLISGYRSVAYQEELYRSYVEQEKSADPNLSQEEAEKKVQTYSQPAGASEHQTGLAIDMSTVDSLNESDPDVVAKVRALAPKYGFVLRFPEGKTDSTGVGYEDWHFRYVGKASAKYMTKHNLTLEEYLTKLKEAG